MPNRRINRHGASFPRRQSSAFKLDAGGVDDLLPSLQLLVKEIVSFRRRLAPARRRAKRLTSARSARSNAAGGTSTSMGTSHAPPSPRRLCRLNPSINRTRPSANRKSGAERSTGFTRAVSIRGTGDVIPSVAGVDDDCCGASFLGGVSFACSGQTNSDFGGTAPTFLYQHLRPSISRHAHQPDSDFGVLGTRSPAPMRSRRNSKQAEWLRVLS